MELQEWVGKRALSWMDVFTLNLFCHVGLCATLWSVAFQAPLSMGFSRQDTGVGCQETFPVREWNQHCFHLRHWQAGSFPLAPPIGACYFIRGRNAQGGKI